MFYDSHLMSRSLLRDAWRKATHQNVLEPVNGINEICDKLSSWVESDLQDRRRRLSLRTSAVFISGTAMIYKDEVDKLYADCMELDDMMIYRRRRHIPEESSDPSPDVDEESSNSDDGGGGGGRRSIAETDSDITGHRTQDSRGRNSSNTYPKSTNSTRLSSSSGINKTNRKNMHDKGIQTVRSYIAGTRMDRENTASVGEELPFGVVMVYENSSRIPSKMIFSSINNNIRNL